MKFKTIDEIKKSYEYKINPLDNVNAGTIEYIYLFGTFGLVFDNYKFDPFWNIWFSIRQL